MSQTLSDLLPVKLRGAEATLIRISFNGFEAVKKIRLPKSYRIEALDKKLRKYRTRAEAKLLERAKLAGIPCPQVLHISEFELILSYVKGSRPKMTKKQCHDAGVLLSKLHLADIIHGDFTPANLLLSKKGTLHVIDFGLGSVQNSVEDKAVDLFTMIQAIKIKLNRAAFLEGYANSEYGKKNSAEIFTRLKKVEGRVRYAV